MLQDLLVIWFKKEEGSDGVRAVCDATVGPGEGTSEREIRSWAESGRS